MIQVHLFERIGIYISSPEMSHTLFSAKNSIEEKCQIVENDCLPVGSANFTPNGLSKEISNNTVKTPARPFSRIAAIQKQLEEQVLSTSGCHKRQDDISPTLAKLRNTPVLKRHPRHIVDYDNVSKENRQQTVRHGVCLWPKSDSLQGKHLDALFLLGQVILLSLVTVIILIKFHGKTYMDLQMFTSEIKAFCDNHYINVESEVSSVADQVSLWHKTLLHKTETLQNYFDISTGSPGYCLYLLCYVLGLIGLLFCLIDSLRDKNRLSPPYIRIWMCLLAVICTWTVVISIGLFQAYQLELQIIHCIHQFSLSVGKVGSSAADLAVHQSILLYWKSRFLDSSSRGLLHILGPITVKDLVNYLYVYSAPISAALLGPVFRLFVSCWSVYYRLR